ncbi:MAG TPA: DNA topoisomerase IV subunit A [Polyangiaceae bacterium LLY-WYZ-15_(1-7)]|nr:DNA topoisomerase IV subunit A [Polyangiaceae bacterium LLY-WYZ-15_(1-7)]
MAPPKKPKTRKKRKKPEQQDLPLAPFEEASLKDELQRRYLNYALSVISSRALPDVRDGLKPVQRRILYAMWNELRLRHDAKYRKSAAIVGEVMGKFHPHGDSAIYDALVRLAQGFTMRAPLVDGRGNFGSPDGDSAAAMRYTEARLQKISGELLEELSKKTVAFRPTFDGVRFEPVVLPARFPNLLVNGVQGIAVGMATSIPPHNLGEVVKACIRMIDDPDISTRNLLRTIKGPDFPTGGQLISSRDEIVDVYEKGKGTLKLRGEWTLEEPESRRDNPRIVITSIPYEVKRGSVVEKIAEVIVKKKMPPLLDVRDESTEETRVVCEIKKNADPQLIMAYLYKNTPLQSTVSFDLTCLVPTEKEDIAAPRRLELRDILGHFLDFRLEVVTKRLQFELDQLEKRIHVLEGFITIFDALDETIRIIRRSEDKADAAKKLMKRFELDELQVDAILELRLHRLARLQILLLREELEAKQKEAKRLRKLLQSEKDRWNLVRAELHELEQTYGDVRRTQIVKELDEPEYDPEAFIVDEDAMVVLTQQGWIKRQKVVKDVSTTRVRDGDAVLEVVAGSTRAAVALFSSRGVCYVTRIVDVPATTGYGNPVQSMFKMRDGERIVAMIGMDPRFLEVPEPSEDAEEPEEPHCVAVTRKGYSLRFSLRGHRDPSTRAGRKYARPAKGDEVVYVDVVEEGDRLACATEKRRALICEAEEVSLLAGPGKGVMLIKLGKGDMVIAAQLLKSDSDALVVQRDGGSDYRISTRKYQVVSRGGKGNEMFKRGVVSGMVYQEPTLPGFPAPDEEE